MPQISKTNDNAQGLSPQARLFDLCEEAYKLSWRLFQLWETESCDWFNQPPGPKDAPPDQQPNQ
jgi:hypothetical protein